MLSFCDILFITNEGSSPTKFFDIVLYLYRVRVGVDLYLNGIRYVQHHPPTHRAPPKPPPKPSPFQRNGLHRIQLTSSPSAELSTFGTTQSRARALVPVAAGSEIRFRVNGTDYNPLRPHLSMSNESIFEPPLPEVRPSRRREALLIKEAHKNRSRSSSVLKRSLFSMANESTGNLAKRMASGFKHRVKPVQKDEDLESVSSSLNSTKRSSTSGSVPQSPLLGGRSRESDIIENGKKSVKGIDIVLCGSHRYWKLAKLYIKMVKNPMFLGPIL